MAAFKRQGINSSGINGSMEKNPMIERGISDKMK
jgi:hypothetical protein